MTQEEDKAVRLCRIADDICAKLSEENSAEEMYQILALAIGMLTVRVAKTRGDIPDILNQVVLQASSFIELCEKHGEANWPPPESTPS